jgi:hypothetical protein
VREGVGRDYLLSPSLARHPQQTHSVRQELHTKQDSVVS